MSTQTVALTKDLDDLVAITKEMADLSVKVAEKLNSTESLIVDIRKNMKLDLLDHRYHNLAASVSQLMEFDPLQIITRLQQIQDKK